MFIYAIKNFEFEKKNHFTGLGSADIAKHWRDDQVFMNPVTMQELGVFIGKPLIINNNCVGFVWPEKDISLTDIGVRQEFLSNNLCKEIGGCVPVCVLPEPYQVATEIQLSIEYDNFFNLKNLDSYEVAAL